MRLRPFLLLSTIFAGCRTAPLEAPPPLLASEPGDRDARADFEQWLLFPTELGRPPDRLDLLARLVLNWPGGSRKGPVTARLFRYIARDADGSEDAGVGITGPFTFCSFWEEYLYMPPEDIFACYAVFDLEQKGRIRKIDDPTKEQIAQLAETWRGTALSNVRVYWMVSLELDETPAVIAGVAAARCGSTDGWAVIDGAQSRFYPKAAFEEGLWCVHILEIHLGRRLLRLGSAGEADRPLWRNYPKPKAATPEALIRAFETVLRESDNGRTLLVNYGTAAAFSNYAKAHQELGRSGELRPLLADLERKWASRPDVHHVLGDVAEKAGLDDIALPHLVLAFPDDRYPGRGAGAVVLARLLVRASRHDEAKEVLLIAMRAALQDAAEAKYLTDRWTFEENYLLFRAALFELLPKAAPRVMAEEQLPASTLAPPLEIPEHL